MTKIARRNLLGLSAAAIVAGPTIAVSSRLAFASDAQAKALAHTHQVSKARQQLSQLPALQRCSGRRLGPCAIFQASRLPVQAGVAPG